VLTGTALDGFEAAIHASDGKRKVTLTGETPLPG
jgi:hypothetical protein